MTFDFCGCSSNKERSLAPVMFPMVLLPPNTKSSVPKKLPRSKPTMNAMSRRLESSLTTPTGTRSEELTPTKLGPRTSTRDTAWPRPSTTGLVVRTLPATLELPEARSKHFLMS